MSEDLKNKKNKGTSSSYFDQFKDFGNTNFGSFKLENDFDKFKSGSKSYQKENDDREKRRHELEKEREKELKRKEKENKKREKKLEKERKKKLKTKEKEKENAKFSDPFSSVYSVDILFSGNTEVSDKKKKNKKKKETSKDKNAPISKGTSFDKFKSFEEINFDTFKVFSSPSINLSKEKDEQSKGKKAKEDFDSIFKINDKTRDEIEKERLEKEEEKKYVLDLNKVEEKETSKEEKSDLIEEDVVSIKEISESVFNDINELKTNKEKEEFDDIKDIGNEVIDIFSDLSKYVVKVPIKDEDKEEESILEVQDLKDISVNLGNELEEISKEVESNEPISGVKEIGEETIASETEIEEVPIVKTFEPIETEEVVKEKAKKTKKRLKVFVIILLIISLLCFGTYFTLEKLEEVNTHNITIILNNESNDIKVTEKKNTEFDINTYVLEEDLGKDFMGWHELLTITELGTQIVKDEEFDFATYKFKKDVTIVAIHKWDQYLFESNYDPTVPEEVVDRTVSISLDRSEINLIVPNDMDIVTENLIADVYYTSDDVIWSAEGDGISVDNEGNITINMAGKNKVTGKVSAFVEDKGTLCTITVERKLSIYSNKSLINIYGSGSTYGEIIVKSNIPVNWIVPRSAIVVSKSGREITVLICEMSEITAVSEGGQKESVRVMVNKLG